MMHSPPYIHSIYIGGPKTFCDAQGEWRSTIARDRVDEPVQVEVRGLVNDQCTQPYHHSPECAICVHLLDHYRFWDEQYGIKLQPGGVGENFVLASLSEDDVCIGDIIRVGTARMQVSAPRIPCANQARHVGRADWVKLTVQELRPGFYLRVLEPGTVQPGEVWHLEERLNPGATLRIFNRCWYHDFDRRLAQTFATLPCLMAWWQERFAEKLSKSTQV
jgi:MOSC domain-containing protein YiiM